MSDLDNEPIGTCPHCRTVVRLYPVFFDDDRITIVCSCCKNHLDITSWVKEREQ